MLPLSISVKYIRTEQTITNLCLLNGYVIEKVIVQVSGNGALVVILYCYSGYMYNHCMYF